MGIFSKTDEKDELVLVFDIGSSSVGGALFWVQKSGIPKIVFAVREPIILEKKINIDRFLLLTAKSLNIVASQVHQAGIGAPSRIFCVLSSPWYVSQTRVISLEKNAPFVFTSKLADELIKKEISLFENEYLTKYAEAGRSVRPIELKNIKTTLNGYETSKPLNQKIKELEMTVFVSISPEQVLKKIEETIQRHFHFKEIKFSSFVLASFAVVRDMYIHQENFLLVDIGGEVTDIAMVKKNILRESVSFPLGRNFITREVTSALGCTFTEAESFVSLLQNEHAEESTARKLGPIINELKKEWLKKFQESLSTISNDISIPATIYMTVDKYLADFFSQTIKTEQFNQYTLTDSKFNVIFLGTEAFHGVAIFKENVIRDPFLIIDSVYINRFFK